MPPPHKAFLLCTHREGDRRDRQTDRQIDLLSLLLIISPIKVRSHPYSLINFHYLCIGSCFQLLTVRMVYYPAQADKAMCWCAPRTLTYSWCAPRTLTYQHFEKLFGMVSTSWTCEYTWNNRKTWTCGPDTATIFTVVSDSSKLEKAQAPIYSCMDNHVVIYSCNRMLLHTKICRTHIHKTLNKASWKQNSPSSMV